MKRSLVFSALGIALGVNLFIGASHYLRGAQSGERDDPYASIAVFTRTLEEVHERYVDAEGLTYSELVNRALKGMLEGLDPHTEFMAPERFEMLREETEGNFGGIGVIVTVRDESPFLTVISPIDGTPGARAGLIAGDEISAINGESTEGMSINDAVERLRGRPGSEVTITVRSKGAEQRDVSLNRAVIKVDTVKDINNATEFPLLDEGVGYIRMSKFGENTFREMEGAINRMGEENIQGLVLDLRDNPGGLLDEAVKICEFFLPPGQLIVTTEGRDGQQLAAHRSGTRPHLSDVPVVVIINEGSASASEIVAGCLQDVGRAVILGERSFGKGSVQSVIPLRDNSALRLTTAKYYTPSHKVIHGVGISPDIEAPLSRMEMYYLGLKRTPGWLDELDEATKSIASETSDRQLDRALGVIAGLNAPATRRLLALSSDPVTNQSAETEAEPEDSGEPEADTVTTE